ncbi:translation initiation factor IF-2 subunit alpha [Sulfolobales archaeon HS-7]|nr:translation initiation factor IF-2 subunit alpha [Sulfolobales archaeon HS-7]
MILRRASLPTEGELVVGTVTKVFDYGSYLVLDEYNNLQAYLPWSEVASKWVTNIKSVIKEKQKIIVKVIRVDQRKNSVDVSLKKVNDDERKKKLLAWKKAQKADKILEIVAKKLGKTEKQAYEEVGWKLEDKFGDIMKGLENAIKDNGKTLEELQVPEVWVKPLLEEVSKHIEEKKFKVTKTVVFRAFGEKGIDDIKNAFIKSIEEVPKEYQVKIYTIGAPRYRIDVLGEDVKKAEVEAERIIKNLKTITYNNEHFEFKVLIK